MNLQQLPAYRLLVPFQTVGANLIYFDLFNPATSATDLYVYSVLPIVSGASAVTGLVSVDLNLNRTTAVGTGGTAATFNGTAFTAATISALNGDLAPISGVTARLTPSGGATAGAWLSWCSVFTEETNAGAYISMLNDMARRNLDDAPAILVKQGTGISVVQGSVASVGTVGFEVSFYAMKK